LLTEARKCVEKGRSLRDAFINIDKQIHMTLAEITGNPIYISVLHSIHDNIHRYYDRFLSMEKPELEENYRDLCDIIEAIESSRVEQARELAQHHVKRFNQYMKKREAKEENA
jgi:DNA-binding GntR family transcriptional regulator